MSALLRLVTAALLVAGMAVAAAPAASAHAALIATEPAADTVLTASPDRVTAIFNEEMQSEFAAMTVVGPDGNLWSTGTPQVQGVQVSVAVRPLGPAGTYTVNYRVTSADGHVVSGSWSFRLTVAGTGAPGPSAEAAAPGGADRGLAVWPFLVGAALLVAGGALWALRRRS